jgi:hypothetical protein
MAARAIAGNSLHHEDSGARGIAFVITFGAMGDWIARIEFAGSEENTRVFEEQ